MIRSIALLFICLAAVNVQPVWSQDAAPLSEATQACLDCHSIFHPGIVEDWMGSRHAAATPQAAMQAQELARKVSSPQVPENLRGVAVGCAECHLLRPDAHADTFDHNGYQVHVVVSPEDCRTCHTQEVDQYSRNIMAHAVKNLSENPIYRQLEVSILGQRQMVDGRLQLTAPDADTRAEACYYCHGTVLRVSGTEKRETDAGEMEFPVIEGWPNQGVGRINLDGSQGSCAACHTRHRFAIEVARKPYTCMECHIGPDVPAYKVYTASKHGNLFATQQNEWDFTPVPWTVGTDFSAPTCAVCHVSLVVDADGQVISERTHEMKDRLAWRIFGLIYAHPQPLAPDTTIIRNKHGQPLPTSLDGDIAAKFLLTPETQAAHTQTMQKTCLACHDRSWVTGHWRRYHNTIQQTNAAIRTVTGIVETAWQRGYAQGLPQSANPFDEAVERQWTDAWLFYANTVRYASAMAGGGDYGVYANGRYQLSTMQIDLSDWLTQREAAAKPQPQP